jgi:hypothetical protein
MTDSWDDYYASDTGSTASDVPAAPEPTLDPDAAAALDSAGTADSWADWNAETADTWSTSADANTAGAVSALEQGDYSGAAYQFEQASYESGVAENYSETAADYASTAADYADTAVAEQSYDSYE